MPAACSYFCHRVSGSLAKFVRSVGGGGLFERKAALKTIFCKIILNFVFKFCVGFICFFYIFVYTISLYNFFGRNTLIMAKFFIF